MPFMLFLAVLFCASPSFAIPISYDFTGLMADGGSIDGHLSYDNEAAPMAINVRGLAPNQVLPVLSYDFTIHPGYTGLPAVIGYAGQSVEFCTGTCIFSSQPVTNLRLSDGLHTLQLAFLGTTPFGGLFSAGSELKSFNQDGSFNSLIMVTSGSMTQVAVPEPSSLLLLGLALVGLVAWRWKRTA